MQVQAGQQTAYIGSASSSISRHTLSRTVHYLPRGVLTITLSRNWRESLWPITRRVRIEVMWRPRSIHYRFFGKYATQLTNHWDLIRNRKFWKGTCGGVASMCFFRGSVCVLFFTFSAVKFELQVIWIDARKLSINGNIVDCYRNKCKNYCLLSRTALVTDTTRIKRLHIK